MNTNELNQSNSKHYSYHAMNSDMDTMSEEELKELKRFLFEERIRLAQESEKQKDVYNKFIKERLLFQEEMKALNRKVLSERKRLKEESGFFDKKMQILQNGFLQLDMDRKKFERDKRMFESRKNTDATTGSSFYKAQMPDFFKGVNNILGLKKRYRDLLKIFHPDNLCGDTEVLQLINETYESLLEEIGWQKKA